MRAGLEKSIRNAIALIKGHTQWEGKDPDEDTGKDVSEVGACISNVVVAREGTRHSSRIFPDYWEAVFSLLKVAQWRLREGRREHVASLLRVAADYAELIESSEPRMVKRALGLDDP